MVTSRGSPGTETIYQALIEAERTAAIGAHRISERTPALRSATGTGRDDQHDGR